MDGGITHGYGLVFWATADNLNFYAFEIAPNGYYRLIKLVNGKWNYLNDWQKTDLVKPGFNKLTVTCRGTSITCYLNGQQVIDIQDSPPAGASLLVSIGANGGVKCSFSDFEVSTN